MKAFWAKFAEYATQAALWAAEHPDQIAAIVRVAQAAEK